MSLEPLNPEGVFIALASAAFAWLLWLSRPRPHAVAPNAMVFAIRSAIPPAMLFVCLLAGALASPLTDTLRLRVDALDISADPAARAGFTVGAQNPSAHDGPDLSLPLPTDDAPPETYAKGDVVKVDGKPALAVRLWSRAAGDVVTLLSVGADRTDQRAFVGATEIKAGDRVCLRDCTGAAAGWSGFHAGRLHTGFGALEAASATARKADDCATRPAAGPAAGSAGAAPCFRRRPGVPGLLSPWGPEQAVYPLRTYFPPSPAGAASPLSRSFAFELKGRWYLVLLDPGAELRTSANALKTRGAPVWTQNTTIAGGKDSAKSVHIHIGRVQLAVAPCEARLAAGGLFTKLLGEAGQTCGNAALRERRSFQMSFVAAKPLGRAELTLDTPEYHSIGAWGAPRARLHADAESDDPEGLSLASIKASNGGPSILGAAVDNFSGAFAAFRARGGAAAGKSDESRPPCDAERWELCAGDPTRAIHFQIDRMQNPWMLVLIAAAAAFAFHRASVAVWATSPTDSILVALIQYLLVFRAIIGVEGAFVDPALDWQGIYGESAMDMVALPTILIALRWRSESPAYRLLALLGFNVLAYLAAWLWLDFRRPDSIQLTFIGLAVGALCVRLATLTPWADATWRRLTADSGSWLGTGVRLLIVAGALRALLPFIGVKERIGPIAVSALYVPLLVFGFAAFVAGADRIRPAERFRQGLWFCGLVGISVVVAPVVARDNGFTLVYLWPILGLGLWRAAAWRREAGGALWPNLPWLAPIPLAVASYAVLMTTLALTAWAPPPLAPNPSSIQKRIEYDLGKSANTIRLMAVAVPSYVGQIGTNAAAAQQEQTLHLNERTSTVFGRGYMLPSNLPTREDPNLGVLRQVHLTDNVSAVHIMAPFGRATAVGILAVLAAAAAGLCSALHREAWGRWQVVAGALSIWTVFAAAAYMILANLLLVPFTGRDIYLLAPTSGSDLLEGLALFVVAYLGLRGEAAGTGPTGPRGVAS